MSVFRPTLPPKKGFVEIEDVGTRTYAKTTENGGYEIGDLRSSTKRINDDSWLLCNGSVISGAQYPELAKTLFPHVFSLDESTYANQSIALRKDDLYLCVGSRSESSSGSTYYRPAIIYLKNNGTINYCLMPDASNRTATNTTLGLAYHNGEYVCYGTVFNGSYDNYYIWYGTDVENNDFVSRQLGSSLYYNITHGYTNSCLGMCAITDTQLAIVTARRSGNQVGLIIFDTSTNTIITEEQIHTLDYQFWGQYSELVYDKKTNTLNFVVRVYSNTASYTGYTKLISYSLTNSTTRACVIRNVSGGLNNANYPQYNNSDNYIALDDGVIYGLFSTQDKMDSGGSYSYARNLYKINLSNDTLSLQTLYTQATSTTQAYALVKKDDTLYFPITDTTSGIFIDSIRTDGTGYKRTQMAYDYSLSTLLYSEALVLPDGPLVFVQTTGNTDTNAAYSLSYWLTKDGEQYRYIDLTGSLNSAKPNSILYLRTDGLVVSNGDTAYSFSVTSDGYQLPSIDLSGAYTYIKAK